MQCGFATACAAFSRIPCIQAAANECSRHGLLHVSIMLARCRAGQLPQNKQSKGRDILPVFKLEQSSEQISKRWIHPSLNKLLAGFLARQAAAIGGGTHAHDALRRASASGLVIGHQAPNGSDTFDFLGIKYGRTPVGSSGPERYSASPDAAYTASSWVRWLSASP